MSFKINKLKFIDSYQFMNSSLEKLVENLYNNTKPNYDEEQMEYHKKNLTKENFEMLYDDSDKHENLPCMKSEFKEHMDLLCRKGFYPYEFVDDIN